MPVRSFLFPRATRYASISRSFNSSAVRKSSSTVPQNHYETLHVSPGATPAEVKKSFYALSKTHHPDRNPNDPEASSRFVAISDAYATLGTPAKRREYDRSLNLQSSSDSNHTRHRAHGSYHSSGPVGGRPASGLSRRRTQYQGPPPSFYRSGGWGTHSAKRKAAQDSHAESPAGAAGMGPGQKPWGHDEVNDVPHFDREGHYRTQENHSRRWQRRRVMEDRHVPAGEVPRSMLANFLFVGGILSLGVFVPSLLFEKMTRRGKGEK
ncbi:DnaJ domain-containing protein [Rhexocercosporidium sp. MPI-PUGE-AT-0058]|nr:DnaJ domain-containing protein [Rhexocercosporidium sp. MPI-PUGE-AT-0058]